MFITEYKIDVRLIINLTPLLRLLQIIAFLKKYLKLYLERKTLVEDIISTQSSQR